MATHGKGLAQAGRRAAVALAILACQAGAWGAVVELNSSGGTTATNGLHIYVEDTSKMQVRRLNNTGQVYSSTAVPPSNNLDNGIFLRANGTIYGPSHTVSAFTVTNYNTRSIGTVSPTNPIADGTTQTVTANYGITSGPQLTVEYRYLRPYDFVTLSVTLVIPSGYAVSAANPVRYYHAIDTFLGGSDNGCGVTFVDANGHRVVGTYPPASGTSCPSSTSIPSGVSIVESFRERSGLGFSHYCTAVWNAFWDTSAPYAACAISNPTSLPDTVTTTYQDTGVGIEYDFTAAGTYTFSYDFVIGSPSVPPYDHLELRYTPGSTLCPMNVTVLGCTSGTVPCPSGSELNANLTGTLTSSGGGGVTWSPSANFTIAAGTPTTSVTATPLAPGGTITLSASGLSSTPLNGVKCWNGSSATCSFTVPNVGCFAGDLDACSNLTGSPARCGPSGNRLYTKVAGQSMSFDLVALTSGSPKAVDTTFNSGSGNPVNVDLVTSAATTVGSNKCPTTSPTAIGTIPAQTIPFTSGRPATATTYTVPAGQNTQAFKNVWVRFDQGAGGQFCSNDRFAIRPAAFTAVTSTTANADATGVSATATPIVKAGAAFSLTADTGTPGYDGTPGVAPALIEWPAAPVGTGTVAGSFSTAATAASGNGASGAAFTYDEVGYFRFQVGGVYDAGFTGAYQDAFDTVCVNTAPNDLSNTPDAAGKVGCKFGNTAVTNYFGRFVPDHFDTAVTQACATGAYTYSGQPFSVTVTAANAAGGTTRNYHGSSGTAFSKVTTLTARDAGDTTADPGPGALTSASIVAAAFTSGVATTVTPVYTFSSATTVPTIVRLRATDSEGTTSLRTAPAVSVEGTTTVRSGRLWLANAYGSEFLPLTVPAEAQSWVGGAWQRNTNDSCTNLVLPTSGNGGLVFGAAGGRNQLAAGETTASLSLPLVSGRANLRLSAPGAGNYGYVDVIGAVVRGASNWLLLPAPSARACFGTCGPRNSVIYSRERF